jgi:hypothetical protein
MGREESELAANAECANAYGSQHAQQLTHSNDRGGLELSSTAECLDAHGEQQYHNNPDNMAAESATTGARCDGQQQQQHCSTWRDRKRDRKGKAEPEPAATVALPDAHPRQRLYKILRPKDKGVPEIAAIQARAHDLHLQHLHKLLQSKQPSDLPTTPAPPNGCL